MRFEFFDAQKAHFPVTIMCDVLAVSRAGYYAWCKRSKSNRQIENEAIVVAIKAIHKCSRGTYGSPRIYAELRRQGWQIGLNRVIPRQILRTQWQPTYSTEI